MKQLNTATELLAYLDDFSIPFSLNEEHAQVLLDYMEGSAYGLHVDEKGQLYWVDLEGNQRIIAGNAQFTGIAAGRGVGFTTGLLLLREGLGMRETPIRPHSWH